MVQQIRRVNSEPVSPGTLGEETPRSRERRMSVIHHRTSTVAGIQGDSGAVIPESLDLRNEGRAQLMVRTAHCHPLLPS